MGAEHQQRIVLAMNLRVRPDIAAAPADDQNLWATVYTIIARARWEMVEEEVAPGILAVRKR